MRQTLLWIDWLVYWGFLCCTRNRIGFGFCVYWKNVTGCLLELCLCGFKQESDCICHAGTESGADSDC